MHSLWQYVVNLTHAVSGAQLVEHQPRMRSVAGCPNRGEVILSLKMTALRCVTCASCCESFRVSKSCYVYSIHACVYMCIRGSHVEGRGGE